MSDVSYILICFYLCLHEWGAHHKYAEVPIGEWIRAIFYTTRNDCVQAGRTTTDLPVRQTYYWPKDDGKPAVSGRAMLMASYDDGLNIGFWDGFRPKHGLRWLGAGSDAKVALEWFHPETQRDDDPDCKEWYDNHAPAAMVAEIQRQIAAIHGLRFVPKVEDASFKDWGDDPFGGGWNSWNIGVRSPEVKEQILKPSEAPVYICGEAYSDAQGWVEGALQTADMMLEKWFDIPPLSQQGGGESGKKPAHKASRS